MQREELTFEQKVYWFLYNYYETGTEKESMINQFKKTGFDNFYWYDELIIFPTYKDELNFKLKE